LLTQAVLQLVAEVLNEHAGQAAGLRIVPVLVEDHRVHLDLLKAAFRHADGVLLDADEARVANGVDDPTLAGIVNQVVRLPGSSGDIELRMVRGANGGFSAELIGATDDATNPAFRTVCGVVNALFDDSLRSKSLAAVAYDETTLGADVKQVLWSLMTSQLEPLALGQVNTLVVLVGVSRADYSRHCSGAVSARFLLDGAGLRRRPTWQTDQLAIRRSLSRLDGHAMLFLGAGFSASSDLPLGNELRDYSLSGLVDDIGSYPERAERLRQLVADHERWLDDEERLLSAEAFASRLTLERVLREERRLRPPPATMPTLEYFAGENARARDRRGPAVRSLGELLNAPERLPRLVIVTVNFDTLVESVASDAVRVFATDEEFQSCPAYLAQYLTSGGRIPLLKLHGTIERPESIVASVDQTMAGLAPGRRAALEYVRDFGTPPVPVIYVGYSMRDLDLRPMLAEHAFARGFDETWVSPFPDPAVYSFCREWRKTSWETAPARGLQERQIGQTADAYFDELVSASL
jgi:hypothetical protein